MTTKIKHIGDPLTGETRPITWADVDAWRPIETGPTDGSDVLLYRSPPEDGYYPDVRYDIGRFEGGIWDGDITGSECRPTHWMPLPEAPK